MATLPGLNYRVPVPILDRKGSRTRFRPPSRPVVPLDPIEQRPQSANTLRARLRVVIGLLLTIAVANLVVTATATIFGVPFVPKEDVVWFNTVSALRIVTGGLAAGLAYSLFRDFDRAIDAL